MIGLSILYIISMCIFVNICTDIEMVQVFTSLHKDSSFLYCHSKQAVYMPHRNMIFSSVNFPVIGSCSRLHILS